jgi:type IV secretion system protein VirB10
MAPSGGPVEEAVAAITPSVPAPHVKRFSRRAVGVVVAAVILVTVLAIGHGLTSRPTVKAVGDATQSSAPVNPTTTNDAINTLPGSYADPKLARIAESHSAASPAGPLGWAAGDQKVPSAMSSPALPTTVPERDQRSPHAREAGFSFAGGETVAPLQGAGTQAPVIPTMPAFSGPANSTTTSRDDDNRQDDKTAYLERERTGRWTLKEKLQHPPSAYTVLTGTVIPGVLITGIDSDLPGQIEGQISENVYDTVTGRYLLLPQGTRLIGSYDSRITYGQSRVLVVWTRLIRPDGSSMDLEGMPGVDLSGYAGATGRVDRHLGRLLTAVLLGSLIQAGTSAGTSYVDPTFTDRARQGAGQGVNEATQQLVRKELQLQPTVEVAPGSRFNVFTTRDLVIPPYAG